MKRCLVSGLSALLASCGFTLAPDSSSGGGPGQDDTVVAPPPPPSIDAIALARAQLADGVHLVLVTSDDGKEIDGADLGVLDGSVMDRIVTQGIENILDAAATATSVHVDYASLLAPVEVAGVSVMTSANYADPAGVSDTPFLFPALADPGPPAGAVSTTLGDMLDYEVQLCVVLGKTVATVPAFEAAPKGFFLCEYIINREEQLDEMDRDDPQTAEGYPDAFSRHAIWRSGPYLYYPRDAAAYLATAGLHLEVNGEVRQDAAVSTMRWSIGEVAKQTLQIGPARRWELDDQEIGLISANSLPAGLVLLTGTPKGVVFQVSDDQDRSRYLKLGDLVEATATHLGSVRMTIK